MAVTQRVGNIAKGLVGLVLETVGIATETIKVAANHLDSVVEDLSRETESKKDK